MVQATIANIAWIIDKLSVIFTSFTLPLISSQLIALLVYFVSIYRFLRIIVKYVSEYVTKVCSEYLTS